MTSTAKRTFDASDIAATSLVARPAKAQRSENKQQREVKPYPFYFYQDFSQEQDSDPLMPVTPAGRVPNFAAKMYAILSRSDLQDMIQWMPHGRSWRILKPRAFETTVIPSYFEHSKLSSFIRQANGWGFRRITQGPDKGSYYHEQFLRGLPHLIKSMKRPGVAEKKAMDAAQEPDLAEISKLHPLRFQQEDESNLLEFTIQGGPKARMPIYTGSSVRKMAMPPPSMPANPSLATCPSEHLKLSAFEKSIGVSEAVISKKVQAAPAPVVPAANRTFDGAETDPMSLNIHGGSGGNALSALSAASQMAFDVPAFDAQAAAQFAAGFAFATAFSQQHFGAILGNLQSHNHQS